MIQARAAAWKSIRGGLFAAGLGISAILTARAEIGGDELNLFARGWLLVARGVFVPFGNPLSSGGKAVGPATTLLVALPLLVWRHFRSPIVFIGITHVVAYLLLDGVVRRAAGERERALFALVYWLNPWRVVAATTLWNPNFLFVFAAIHLATAFAQRERASFALSFTHALAIGIAFELHPSAFLLAILSILLWARGWVRLSVGGFAAGTAAFAATLVPWIFAISTDAALSPLQKGFPGRGLLLVYPLLRGILYWFRHASLMLAGAATTFDFAPAGLGRFEPGISSSALVVLYLFGVPTTIAALAANVRLWRERGRRWLARAEGAPSARGFLETYAVFGFAAAAIGYAIIPTTTMSWQGLVLLHAATIPVVLWLAAGMDGPRARTFRAGGVAWGAGAIVVLATAGAGGALYRCGGREPMTFPLRSHSAMFEELGIQRDCAWPLDRPGTWWPDVLPEGGEDSPPPPAAPSLPPPAS